MTLRLAALSLALSPLVVALSTGAGQAQTKETPACAAASLSIDASVQATHKTGAVTPDGAVVVRRGAFVRAGLELADAEGCADPSLRLRDVASGAELDVPIFNAEDGLALTLANAAALGLATQGPNGETTLVAGCEKGEASCPTLGGSLGGALGGDVGKPSAAQKGKPSKLESYAELVASGGTPFYSVVVERQAQGSTGAVRASLAVWLPEHLPVGAYELQLACAAQPVGSTLPLVVLFNPYTSITAESLPDAKLRALALGTTPELSAGPLTLDVQVDGDDPAARDLMLEWLAAFPLSARAHPALVARAGGLGPLQLSGRANTSAPAEKGAAATSDDEGVVLDGLPLWKEALAWSDATGHFDLWSLNTPQRVLRGRWDGNYAAPVAVAPKKAYRFVDACGVLCGESKASGVGGGGKGLVGMWDFDDQAAQDTSGAKGKGLPAHNPIRVSATVHFVDDWQGETAYLRGVPSEPPRQGDYCQPLLGTAGAAKSGAPTKYGQCWVFSSLLTRKAEPGTCTTAKLLETFRATREAMPVGPGREYVLSLLGKALNRSMGIPTRSVTNFDSAHEHKTALPAGVGPHNCALATVSADGAGDARWDYDSWVTRLVAAGGGKDSVWNFHVWNESAMKSGGGTAVWNFHVWNESWLRAGGANGWTAYDGTCQEMSDGRVAASPYAPELAATLVKNVEGPAVLTSRNPATWFFPASSK